MTRPLHHTNEVKAIIDDAFRVAVIEISHQLRCAFAKTRIPNVIPQNIRLIFTNQFMPMSISVGVVRVILWNRTK